MFDTYKVVIQCLQNQFQNAIHEDYLAKLDDADINLTNVHPSIIYQHIIDQYAKIDFKNAEENQKPFNAPMDLTKPLAVYTKKQECSEVFMADTSNPINMVDMVQMGVMYAVAMDIMWDA